MVQNAAARVLNRATKRHFYFKQGLNKKAWPKVLTCAIIEKM